MEKAGPEQDAIDGWLAQWAPQLPEIDLEVEGIVERIQAINRMLKRSLEATLADFGLSLGEWMVLGHLRKSGPPYRNSPGRLAAYAGLSSGAMTNRLDRMEEAGLIRRLPDPEDRRGVVVELTDAGHRAWLESVGVQAEKEALVADALDPDEKRQLNALLRRLTLSFQTSGLAGDGRKERPS